MPALRKGVGRVLRSAGPQPAASCGEYTTPAPGCLGGRWEPGISGPRGKGNWQLAGRLRWEYKRLLARRGHANVQIRHVRSHTGESGNEVADVLAKEGAQSTRDEETARNGAYIDGIERRPPAQDEPQHRKTARRK